MPRACNSLQSATEAAVFWTRVASSLYPGLGYDVNRMRHRKLPAADTALFSLRDRTHLLSTTGPAKPPLKNSVSRDAALLALSSESVVAWRNSLIRFSLALGLYAGPAGQHCYVSEGSLEGQ